ncbi:MAG: glycosyltransferase family 1 protein, partial [Bacteroidetes bacterium]|nr:glycosyltransferase family 1 protein [Bacteroidota bacterium]
MNKNKINIISFNIPYPANYGGVIDVFHKIKTLHNYGYEVVLHCFQYGRQPQPELEKYCSKIYYYKRKKGFQHLFSPLPYIVATRKNKQLLENIKANNYPILFEGVHTCFYVNHPDLANRKKMIRMHNIEHHYYEELAKATTDVFKKLFFYIESKKLKKYERILSNDFSIIAISKNDYNYFIDKHSDVKYIPAFHPLEEVISKPGKGDYFLYHGNLAVEENEKAVLFLIEKVFLNAKDQLIIAGKSPTNRISQKVQQNKNIKLEANPTEKAMNALIINAHCCVLPTFQATGLKLKLLVSLFL